MQRRSVVVFFRSLIVLLVLVQTSEQTIWNLVQASDRAGDNDNKLAFSPIPTPLVNRDLKKLNLLEVAYLDAYTILRQDNRCSRLFGGPGAVDALTDFVARLKPVNIDRAIAIRMTGETTNFQSHRTGFSYRLFDKAEINLGGPFYRPSEGKEAIASEYHANGRATRIVALLHEVGHLVRGADNKWLLPDDGGNVGLSLKNSETVVEACHEEIAVVTKLKSDELVESGNVESPK